MSIIIIIVTGFSGCDLPTQNTDDQQSTEDLSNTSNENLIIPQNVSQFEWNDDLRLAFVNRETAERMEYAGIFYFGNFAGFDQYSQDYYKAREAKSDEVIISMNETISVVKDLENAMQEMRAVTEKYFSEILKNIPESEELITNINQKLTNTKNQSAQTYNYLSQISVYTEGLPKSPEWGALQYAKFAGIFGAVENYTAEISQVNSSLITFYYLLENEPAKTQSNLNKELDSKLEPVSQKVDEIVQKLYAHSHNLAQMEKLLFTADYYFALGFTRSLEQEINKMEKTITEYDQSKPIITADFLKAITAEVALLKKTHQNHKEQLENIPQTMLLNIDELALSSKNNNFTFIPEAWAFSLNPLEMLKKGAGKTLDTIKAGGEMAWSGVKKATQTVKDGIIKVYDKSGAHEVTKALGTITGVALETTDATIKSIIDVVQGAYYDDNMKDTINGIKANYNQIMINFDANKSGHQIYKDAYTIVKGGADIINISNQITLELTFGKGATVNTISSIYKSLVDTTTSLAKDIYVALDPQTSKDDSRAAVIGLALSAVEASSKVLKLPQDEAAKNLNDLITSFSDMTIAGEFGEQDAEKLKAIAEKEKNHGSKEGKELLRMLGIIPEPLTPAQIKELEKQEAELAKAREEAARPYKIMTAHGTFGGDFEGALTLTFAPRGVSNVKGTMTADGDTISVSGFTNEGKISASLSGTVSYEIYDEKGITKTTCSMWGKFEGYSDLNSASGTYSGICGEFNGSGTWNLSW